MSHIENGIYTSNCLFTETHNSFPIQYGLCACVGGKCSKHILTCFYCTKYNEIDKGHPYIQMHSSYKKLYKAYEYFCIQAYTKVFRYIAQWGKIFKVYFNIFVLH